MLYPFKSKHHPALIAVLLSLCLLGLCVVAFLFLSNNTQTTPPTSSHGKPAAAAREGNQQREKEASIHDSEASSSSPPPSSPSSTSSSSSPLPSHAQPQPPPIKPAASQKHQPSLHPRRLKSLPSPPSPTPSIDTSPSTLPSLSEESPPAPPSSLLSRSLLSSSHSSPSPLYPSPSSTTPPLKVIVYGHGRSGTSFVANVFNNDPRVFYLFEPLYDIPEHERGPQITDILNCKLHPRYFRNVTRPTMQWFMNEFVKPKSGKGPSKWHYFPLTPSHMRRITAICLKAPIRVLKIINSRFFSEAPPEAKLIHVLRSPVRVINSWVKHGWIDEGDHETQLTKAEKMCKSTLNFHRERPDALLVLPDEQRLDVEAMYRFIEPKPRYPTAARAAVNGVLKNFGQGKKVVEVYELETLRGKTVKKYKGPSPISPEIRKAKLERELRSDESVCSHVFKLIEAHREELRNRQKTSDLVKKLQEELRAAKGKVLFERQKRRREMEKLKGRGKG